MERREGKVAAACPDTPLNMDRMAQRSEAGFKKTLALCRVRMNCSGDVFEPRTHFER